MNCSRRAVVVLVAAAAVAWCIAFVESAAPALGATTTPTRPGTFSITPPTHLLRGTPGIVLTPTAIGNSTPQALRVTVIPVLVHETASGSFDYSLSAASRRAAARIVDVSTHGFALPAQSRHAVYERWRPGAPHRNAWVGVIFRGVPAGSAGRTGVRAIDQLLGLDLMAVRGAAPARGQIKSFTVADAGAHRVALTLAVRNVGATFGTPTRLHEIVRAADGHVVAQLSPTSGLILPGVTRDFTAALHRRLPAGRYTATASVEMPGRLVARPLHLGIAPNGLLLAPSLVAGTVTATGRVGGRASVRVALRNQGTRAGAPHGTVTLYALRGAIPGAAAGPRAVQLARAPLGGRPVAAGRSAVEQLTLGRLHRGDYRIVVAYAAPFVATNPAQVDFTPRPDVPWWESAWRFIRSHGLLFALAAAAVCIAAAGLRTGRGGRRRHRMPTGGIRLRPLP